MNIKACIFDLDGVIVDSAKYHFLAWKALADKLNIDFTEQDNEALKGVSRIASLNIILDLGNRQDISEAEKENLAREKNELYLKYIEKMTPREILPGVEDFLKELKGHGIAIALGSASKNAPHILDLLELRHYFDALIDGNQVSKAKPDPEVFLKGAEALGVSAENCVVFEDAQAGVEAALAGSMGCIAVGDPVVLNKAHRVIEGFSDFNYQNLMDSF